MRRAHESLRDVLSLSSSLYVEKKASTGLLFRAQDGREETGSNPSSVLNFCVTSLSIISSYHW